MTITPKDSRSTWYEVVLAYGWLREGPKVAELARRLSPAQCNSSSKFLESLQGECSFESLERCRRTLEAAGCSFQTLFGGDKK